ncbi:MAG: hypothetical protein ACQCN5_09120 [Candidatus Bathyarchaeia archaeon]
MEHRLADTCLRHVKNEFEVYYTLFFSRKACPFLCITFCGLILVGYLLGNTSALI